MISIIEDKIERLKSLKVNDGDVGYKTAWVDALTQVGYIIDEQKAINFRDDVESIVKAQLIFNNVNEYIGDELKEYNGYELEVKDRDIQMTYFKGTVSVSIGGKLRTMQAWKVLKTLKELVSSQEESVKEVGFEETLTEEPPIDISQVYGTKK